MLEGLLVAVAGAALAFAANALSPRGLSLARDYFPNDRARLAISGAARPEQGTTSVSPAQLLESKAKELGIRLAGTEQVLRLYRQPGRETGQVLFIDARDNENYLAGHIPGAYQLDYYHKEEFLPEVLPRCLAAQQVVVYCNGGSCEDSLLTASVLLAPVVPKDRLLVYAGGFTEWTNNRLPVEVGARASGKIIEASSTAP